MQKSKLIAFALSAISTGILVSCAKPADGTDAADNIKADSKQTDQHSNKEAVENKAIETSIDKKTEKKPSSSVISIELPAKQTTAYLQHLSQNFVIPLYKDSATQSKLLSDKAVNLCKGGAVSAEQMGELRSQWLAVAKAWAKAEAINYGPAYDNMSHLYINYFPDERGLVHKSIKSLIADNPNLKAEKFIDESAIVQGIPALEDVLFTNDMLDTAQCNYLVSASQELNRRFTDIADHWEKDGNTLLDTETPIIGMNQFFNGLLFHIENLKSTGIDKALGINSMQKGHVPAQVSGESRAIVEVKLASLQDALTDEQLIALIGNSDDGKKVIQQITVTLDDTKTQLLTLPEDISKADKAEQAKLYDNLTTLTKHIKRGIMPLLSVQLGFNSTDGD